MKTCPSQEGGSGLFEVGYFYQSSSYLWAFSYMCHEKHFQPQKKDWQIQAPFSRTHPLSFTFLNHKVVSFMHTQAIHTNMVKSYKKKSKQYVKVQSFQYLGVLYLQEKWWWHLLPNKLFLIGHQSTNANSHQITYNKQINQSIFIDWSGLNHDVVTPYRSI